LPLIGCSDFYHLMPKHLLISCFFLVANCTNAAEMEEIIVTADQNALLEYASAFSSISLAPNEDSATSTIDARTLADQIASLPGVSLSGQGGSLQAYAIRGMSRWRIQTRLETLPVYTERRAGNSLSFVDPWFIASVDVIKGPAAARYGSGAMGGTINVRLRWHEGLAATASLANEGEHKKAGLGWGNEHHSIGLAMAHGNHTTTKSGQPLNDGARQAALLYRSRQNLSSNISSTLQLMASRGKDIGKSASDYPLTRITHYPEERHTWLSWQIESDNHWQLRTYIHDQSLKTRVSRPSLRNETDASSLDSGLSFFSLWTDPDHTLQFGMEANQRQHINISEETLDMDQNLSTHVSNLKASYRDGGLYADYQWRTGRYQLRANLRHDRVYQKNHLLHHRTSDTHESVFLGAGMHINDDWRAYTHLSSGFRFPQISEQFYTGTTGRGDIIGNPGLLPEDSTSLETGFIFSRGAIRWTASLYRMKINEYIAQIETGPGRYSFINLESGTIKGLEFSISYRSSSFALFLNGHVQQGKSNTNRNLADMSAPVLHFGFLKPSATGRWKLTYAHRFASNDIGESELPLDAKRNLSLDYRQSLTPSLSLSFWASNLLNDDYRQTADNLSPRARRRGAGITVIYSDGHH